MRSSSLLLSLSLALRMLAPSVARADEPAAPRLPVAAADRPLTLPQRILSPALELDSSHPSDTSGSFTNLDVRAAYGITNDFTVRALVAPLQLAGPDNAYAGRDSGARFGQLTGTRGPGAGLTYRFLSGTTEIGIGADFRVFTLTGYSGVNFTPSIPFRFHPSRHVRLALTTQLEIVRGTRDAGVTSGAGGVLSPTLVNVSANSTRVNLPFEVLGNITESFYLAVNTGLVFYDLQTSSPDVAVPLGATIGYAIPGKSGPIVNIAPYFDFPYLLITSKDNPANSSQYVLGITLEGYLYL